MTATRPRPARILAAGAAAVLPYDQPPAAQPRVFAHYFAPAGEAGKHAAYGGLPFRV